MKNSRFAKEQLVEDYLTSLLTQEPQEESVQRESVAKLLQEAELPAVPIPIEPVEVVPLAKDISVKDIGQQVDIKKSSAATEPKPVQSTVPTTAFQALFFNVAGLTLALPLTELGGIHKLDKIGPLFGKPSWFKGVMLHRQEKLSVVDTAKWVMPEKYDEKLAESLKYQYLIMLDSSHWGLACESLINTVTLQPEDVKWRQADGKRPWLAGMVKKKMCALINVQQLIDLLNQGLGSNDK